MRTTRAVPDPALATTVNTSRTTLAVGLPAEEPPTLVDETNSKAIVVFVAMIVVVSSFLLFYYFLKLLYRLSVPNHWNADNKLNDGRRTQTWIYWNYTGWVLSSYEIQDDGKEMELFITYKGFVYFFFFSFCFRSFVVLFLYKNSYISYIRIVCTKGWSVVLYRKRKGVMIQFNCRCVRR